MSDESTPQPNSLFVQDEGEDSDQDVVQLDYSYLQAYPQSDSDDEQIYPLIPNQTPLRPKALDETEQQHTAPPPIFEVQSDLTLHYHQRILQDLLSCCCVSNSKGRDTGQGRRNGALLVMGQGMGMLDILANFILCVTTSTDESQKKKNKSITFILGLTDTQSTTLRTHLSDLDSAPYHIINSESSTLSKRRQLYTGEGGTFIITPRILIVDMLSQTVPLDMISNIVVYNVERFNDMSVEWFILDLFRRGNQHGAVWGFGEDVGAISSTVGLSELVRGLKVGEVLLWPRFHIDVVESLTTDNQVIEIKIRLTKSMQVVQSSLWQCLNKCISELRRENPEIIPLPSSSDQSQSSKENQKNATATNQSNPAYLKLINTVLTRHWHQISQKSKQLLRDISTIRQLLQGNLKWDCVEMRRVLDLITESNRPTTNPANGLSKSNTGSLWLQLDESSPVLSHIVNRVVENKSGELVLEENPKWEQLGLLLKDIEQEEEEEDGGDGSVVIFVSDEATKVQLYNYISVMKYNQTDRRSVSGRAWLMRKYKRYLQLKELRKELAGDVAGVTSTEDPDSETGDGTYLSKAFQRQTPTSGRRRARGGAAVAAVGRLWSKPEQNDNTGVVDELNEEEMSELIGIEDETEDLLIDEDDRIEEQIDNVVDIDQFANREHLLSETFQEITSSNIIQIHSLSSSEASTSQVLSMYQPSHIIIYDPSLPLIREVETYRTTTPTATKVYFMYYTDSTEEQEHLNAIRTEKDAFTTIIRQRANLAQRYEVEGETGRNRLQVYRYPGLNSGPSSTRNAQNQTLLNVQPQIILVDIREFNATLPGLLTLYQPSNSAPVQIIPLQLSIADYVVSPEIAIERKTIPDLIQSLGSGRLMDQARRMSLYYTIPILLIEYDGKSSFSLTAFSSSRHTRVKYGSVSKFKESKDIIGIQRDLANVVRAYPRLRVVWCDGAVKAAGFIWGLKIGRETEQPDLRVCLSYGSKSGGKPSSKAKTRTSATETSLMALLKEIPCNLSQLQIYTVLRRLGTSGDSVGKFKQMNETELRDLFGDEATAVVVMDWLKERYSDNEEEAGED
ncbi:hypothetical protein WICPIJ_009516 [Wickerhamomyces pijperi]|uniref:ERCC4 domain-containing protein n=1 Tax=Wickerhamomyces pijperi TaxID=599730 RepID=A0A9P8PLW5_WICPI|nr:hypothetical protein WICPIJ_009516 [Wickerhamomyces pijperi]